MDWYPEHEDFVLGNVQLALGQSESVMKLKVEVYGRPSIRQLFYYIHTFSVLKIVTKATKSVKVLSISLITLFI